MKLQFIYLVATCLALSACSSPQLKEEQIRHEPGYASPPASEGIPAELAKHFIGRYGPEYSGFRLLDSSYDALAWRLALIDSAVSSLDIQTYLWYPDNAGRIILERAVEAARRGVRVRLVIDDLLTIGHDQVLYDLNQHPNIELRLFNPWKDRNILSRGGEMVAEFERLNTRMHDKLVIVDGNATVVGGRNIGDHYFGLSSAYNFHDLDLFGVGHIARQANGMFDHFWNSEWVVSADNLVQEHDPEFAAQKWEEMKAANATAPELEAFRADSGDWIQQVDTVLEQLHPGTSELLFDTTVDEAIEQNVAGELFKLLGLAQKELLITNAYIIPGQPAIDFLKGMTDRGVKVRILTNSLASHDVPAVNSHYQAWRDDLIQAGTELYELRADAAIQSIVDVPPAKGEFTGLHTKSFVVDREKVFVGSMNFDPRSMNINTEAGAFVHSPGLAEDLARVMERDMDPENAWQVLLDENGEIYWVNSDERVDKQPARDGMQRAMDAIFKIFPKDQY